jgi:hypothetical protein
MMASILSVVYQRLTAAVGVQVSGRIYPLVAPTGAAMPFVVYEPSFDAVRNLRHEFLDVTILARAFSSGAAEAVALGDQIALALDGVEVTPSSLDVVGIVELVSSEVLYDEEVYQHVVVFSLGFHREV